MWFATTNLGSFPFCVQDAVREAATTTSTGVVILFVEADEGQVWDPLVSTGEKRLLSRSCISAL